jgi:hypothetical protein
MPGTIDGVEGLSLFISNPCDGRLVRTWHERLMENDEV